MVNNPMTYKTEEQINKEFDELEWPMSLANTGVDMEMIERDKQVKAFIHQVREEDRGAFLNQPANAHDQEVRKQQRESLREWINSMTATGVGAIPETNDYANGWNDCRKRAFEQKKQFISDLLAHLDTLDVSI